MTKSILWGNLGTIFPELESIPHADTLARLSEKIDVNEIQSCLVQLLKDLMRKKKFKGYLRNNKYLIAVDGKPLQKECFNKIMKFFMINPSL